MTETEEMAQRYMKRQRGIELQAHLATLGSKLKDLASTWAKLGNTFGDVEYSTFITDGETITVRRPRPDIPSAPGRPGSLNTVASVPVSSFDPQELQGLLHEIEKTKTELADIRKLCREMGQPL